MAQTKRKRRTKHRGNAAGMIETRGRTGRKLTDTEKKGSGAKAPRPDRRDEPPTWKGSLLRAGVAAVIFVAVLLGVFKQKPAVAFTFFLVMLVLYIPMSYYMDLYIYRRRMARKAKG